MNRKTKTIERLDRELADGESIFKQARSKLKKAKGKLQRDNQKRALKVIKKAVEALDDQKDIIKAGGAVPAG